MTRVEDLIEHFSSNVSQPLEVETIVDELIERGVKDEIFYYPAPIVSDVLKGQIVHWEYGGKVYPCADIYYAESLPIEWQRVVVCKEVLHLLDAPATRTSTADEVEHLVSRIVLPDHVEHFMNDGPQARTDKFAIHQAIAVLFPMGVRALLKPPYDAKLITAEDIQRLTCLPLKHVVIVMHDIWATIYPMIARRI